MRGESSAPIRADDGPGAASSSLATTDRSPAWGPVPSGERWSTGRWSLDVRADELADVRCDDQIVLRGIRAVARDADWQTAWPRSVTHQRDGERLAIDLEIAESGIDLVGTVRVAADGDRLTVSFEATARTASSTNRTGLVVLHPPQLAGTGMTVGRTDGAEDALRFPVAISPHQPAREIAALTWSDHGTRFRLDLEGDVFEMEDQRNWSDASYKTYNRSLDEPFPYTIAAGEHIHQRVVLTAGPRGADGGDPARSDPAEARPAPIDPARVGPARIGAADVRPDAVRSSDADADATTARAQDTDASGPDVLHLIAAGEFPTIAVGASTAPDPGPTALDPIAAHRHVELELTDPAWPAALERALIGAEDLSLMLVSPSAVDRTAVAEVVRALGDVPLRWAAIVDAVSHVSEPALVEALRSALPEKVPVVGGSRSHYTELNREWDRVPHAGLDGLVFPTTPLFHTRESEQLVEAVAMQRVIADDVTSRVPGVPVHVGPVTLRPRFNNVATTPSLDPSRTDLAEGYGAQRTGSDDPRQASPELAAWSIASAAALAVPGVASLTYFEQWGPRGLRTADGAALPVRAALEALTDLQGGQLLTAASPDGLLWAIGARREEHDDVLVANLSGRSRCARVAIAGVTEERLEIAPVGWRAVSSPR